MTHSISIRANFEAGHRLPHLPGKCQSLHGHSFWAEVTIGAYGVLPPSGIVVDYGTAKAYLRGWIDREWDHGLILGRDDDLVPLLTPHGKVFPIDGWPTVENLAWYLGQVMVIWCHQMNQTDLGQQGTLVCKQVTIRETHVNAATWINGRGA